ncbi:MULTISPECIES: hemolysin family protein [unclassified Frondihabitans]|jgi:CBS domain containing-hemolysin-like protein|uniref:hemolysin family protein n=1 Tax=unclassified Frondihabitans TaxID=2626248 RepID=UPI000F4F7E91|nr:MULTISPECIES: hemolysin family protein [unclassified Frondihabitans]RPE75285.1 CBS domain containing-hemolysin-like protein [Frondihabitans sp. PhB153]RPF04527.1 CBS domain containing-hemolysin-like protein [Frondihabitans sp. PhB161]
MMIAIFVTAAVLLVVFGGVLAATDSALTVLSRADLLELAEKRRRGGSALVAIADDIGAHVNAVNFVRILAETAAAVLVSLAFAYTIAEWWWALLLSALIMTLVSFVLVGSSPRSVGRAHARALIGFDASLVRAIRLVLGPVAALLVALGDRVTPGRNSATSFSSEEQLLSMVDEATEMEVLDEDDRTLIHSIFEFSETVVREVMVPRTDMVTVDADATIETTMGVFLGKGVSRVPVVGRDSDDILGIVYLRDTARFLHEGRGASLRYASDLAKPAVFVPESKRADETLRQMQAGKNHLAMIVDEYGGIAGLVTLEDLIEELVGDISDEYDQAVSSHREVSDGVYLVSARLPVDELGDLFGIELDDDDVDSVGGLLTKALGRLPERGSEATVSGLILTANRTEGRRRDLQTVLVRRDPALIASQAAFAAHAGSTTPIRPNSPGSTSTSNERTAR